MELPARLLQKTGKVVQALEVLQPDGGAVVAQSPVLAFAAEEEVES
jgi:hypothetical protein